MSHKKNVNTLVCYSPDNGYESSSSQARWVKDHPITSALIFIGISGLGYGVDAIISCIRDKKKTEDNYKAKTKFEKNKAKIREEEREKIRKEKAEEAARQRNEAEKAQQEPTPEVVDAKFETVGEKLAKPISKIRALIGKLFGEGEIGVIFGPKGVGKSTLIYQIVEAIATGKKSNLFSNDYEEEPTPQAVYVYDLEQHDNQIQKRLAGFTSTSNVFILNDISFSSVDAWLNHVKAHAGRIDSKAVFVLDNITKLGGWESAASIRSLFAGMEKIQNQAKERGATISFIIVGHSNKAASDCNPFTDADLIGSSSIMDFASCVLAIGPTNTHCQKYIKILHNRNHEEPELVKVIKMVHTDDKPLSFEYVGEKKETDVLPRKKGCSTIDVELSEEEKFALIRSMEGSTNSEIAKRLNCSESTVRNLKKKMPK